MSSAAPRERELKLSASPDALRQVAGRLPARARPDGPATVVRLVSDYFDTADLRLGARRLALRVRHDGRRRVQTLKAASVPGSVLADRPEWEVAIASDRPDLAAFDSPDAVEETGLILPDDLRKQFTVDVERTRTRLAWTDGSGAPSRIELAVDRGEVRAGRQAEPLGEIELELLDGSPQALFELAAAIRRMAPVRLGVSDKAMRGYRLLTGSPPKAVRMARPASTEATTVSALLAEVVQGCIAHAVANEAAASDGRDVEGVHQLRVALRRLRSALSVFRPALPEAARLRWAGEARWLLGKLGPCRDLDVFLADVLAPLKADPQIEPLLEALAAVARDRQAVAQTEARAAIGTRRAGDLFLGLACWVSAGGWEKDADAEQRAWQERPPAQLGARMLARRARRVRKAGRGFSSLAPAQRHVVRIALKKLRYGIEFFVPVYGSQESRRYHQAVAALQDNLGQLNDIEVARLMVERLTAAAPRDRRVQAALGGGLVVGWYAHAARALEAETLELWDRFRSIEPFWRSDE